MGNPKTKGGDFERKIAKKLSLWFTNGERDDIFWRTQSSGGRFTQRAKNNQNTENQGGDITFTDPIGKPLIDFWNLELKKGYSKTNLLNHIDSNKNTEFESLWNQCLNDADKCNKEPMLILKRDRKKEVVFINKSVYNKLIDEAGYHTPCKLIVLVYENRDKIIGMELDNFLNWISSDCIKGLANEKEHQTKTGKGRKN